MELNIVLEPGVEVWVRYTNLGVINIYDMKGTDTKGNNKAVSLGDMIELVEIPM